MTFLHGRPWSKQCLGPFLNLLWMIIAYTHYDIFFFHWQVAVSNIFYTRGIETCLDGKSLMHVDTYESWIFTLVVVMFASSQVRYAWRWQCLPLEQEFQHSQVEQDMFNYMRLYEYCVWTRLRPKRTLAKPGFLDVFHCGPRLTGARRAELYL